MTQNSREFSHLTVLAVFGHPDDEGFSCGGTLAMLADMGASITMVSATNGDVGEISDPSLATPQTLARVRQEEMRQAALVTGAADVRFLGYRDSGMAGTEDNNHHDSLYQAPADQVVRALVAIIREVRPDMIITHDPTGGYGHPDHMTTYARVTQAFALAGRRGRPAAPARFRGSALVTRVAITTHAFPAASCGRCGKKCVTPGSRRLLPARSKKSLWVPRTKM